jgi:hypothetical protein
MSASQDNLQADQHYVGIVAAAEWTQSSKAGTLGLEIQLHCPDGDVSHTIWFSEKNLDNFKRQMRCLGLTDEQIDDHDYLFDSAPGAVLLSEVTFRLKWDEFEKQNGDVVRQLKVLSIGPVLKADKVKAQLASVLKKNGKVAITNEDIPF